MTAPHGWNVPAPLPDQIQILARIGDAMLWPGSSQRWRDVLRWCDNHRSDPISKTILEAFAGQGGDVKGAFAIGQDAHMIEEKLEWTQRFATAHGGDVSVNLALRLEERRRAAMRRAAAKTKEFLG